MPFLSLREAAGMAQHGGGKGDLPALQAAQGDSVPRTVCTLEPADVKMALGQVEHTQRRLNDPKI